MHRATGLLVTLLIALAPGAEANDVTALSGNWRTVMHGADVKIADCGDGSPCGYLVSVSDQVSGGHTTDIRNKNKALRARPLNGLPILWGYSRGSAGWAEGRLYNPDTGQTFRSTLKLIAPDKLQVKGCLGPFCRQQIWTRIDPAAAITSGELLND